VKNILENFEYNTLAAIEENTLVTVKCSVDSKLASVIITNFLLCFFSEVPGQPAVKVKQSDIKARATTVTWSYSPGSDEAPIVSFYLHYQNKSFNDNITLSGSLSSKELIHLKPYTSYTSE